MSEHLSIQQQTALIEHKLDVRHLPQTLAHLTGCAACRRQVNRQREVGEPAPVWVEEDDWSFTKAHLSYEQLAGYVTESLAEVEREIAGNHLSVCEFCAAEIRALRTVKAELKELTNARKPAEQATTAAGWTKSAPAWHTAVWHKLWPLAPSALAWSAPLLLLLSLSGWWLWQTKQAERQELALARQPGARTTEPVQTATQTTKAAAPQPPGDILLAIVDHGQPLALRSDGQLSSPVPLPQAYEELLKRTLTNQRLALPALLNELKSGARDLRSGEVEAPRFALLAPLGKVVQTNRPVFRWQFVPGAANYIVAVLDRNFNPVLTSEALSKPEWQASRPLPRGRVYLWQVTAQVGEQQFIAPAVSAPDARFQILAQDKAAELQRAAANFKQSHLLLGTFYAQAGLLAEAERELQALLAENPQSAVVKKLLQQVRRVR